MNAQLAKMLAAMTMAMGLLLGCGEGEPGSETDDTELVADGDDGSRSTESNKTCMYQGKQVKQGKKMGPYTCTASGWKIVCSYNGKQYGAGTEIGPYTCTGSGWTK